MELSNEELNQRIDLAHRAWCQTEQVVIKLEEARLWLERALDEARLSQTRARAALDLISGNAVKEKHYGRCEGCDHYGPVKDAGKKWLCTECTKEGVK
jgi:hypothetical protein